MVVAFMMDAHFYEVVTRNSSLAHRCRSRWERPSHCSWLGRTFDLKSPDAPKSTWLICSVRAGKKGASPYGDAK